MLYKRVPRQLWEYGVSWVSEVMSITHYSYNIENGGIPLTNVTGKTVDITEYLDFGLYDKVLLKDNVVISPGEPGRWLWISHWTGMLMCYHILT